MKKSILIGPSSFGKIDPGLYQTIENAGYNVIKNPFDRKIKKNELIDLLTDNVIGLIAGLETLDAEVLEKSKLKIISRVGSGVTNIDKEFAKNNNIKIFSVSEGPTNSVAEITIANILNLLKNIFEMNLEMKKANWHRIYGNELKNKKVLIIGYGNIGKRVSEILNVFKADVYFVDPSVNDQNAIATKKSLSEGLQLADIIVLHASTQKCIITSTEFEKMKDGVLLCNPARGELINEADLIKYIENKKVAGAWIDTYIDEPYSGKLNTMKEVILTPHISSLTYECRGMMDKVAVNNLLENL